MARVTVYLRNGKEFDFECSQFSEQHFKVSNNKLTELKPMKKDNGLSLMFIDPTEVVAIVRDTRKDDD